MTKSVLAALAQRRNSWLPEWWSHNRTLSYSLSGVLAVLILAAIFDPLDFQQRHSDKSLSGNPISSSVRKAESQQVQTGDIKKIVTQDGLQDLFAFEKQAPGTLSRLQVSPEAPSGPMIIRSSQLMLISRDFETARAGIESIVRDAKGYIDSMSVQTNPGSAKSLTAVLRVPSDRVDNALANLRNLGQTREESQNSTDITGQYVDLSARLNNARNTEQRLLTLLRERTGNLKDIVAAEGELSRVREGIEQMEAQRKSFDNQVQYASIQVGIREEYHAELQPHGTATGTRFHNAAVEGLDSAKEAVLGIALSFLAYGPGLLVWLTVVGALALLARALYRSLAARRRLRSAGSL